MSTIVYTPQPVINSVRIPVPQNTLCKALEFVNETPYLMIVSLSGQFGQFIMQPYTTRYKNMPGFGNGEVDIFLLAAMNGSGQAPLNLFGLVSYGPEDPDQADFVIQSDRLNSIGNAASVGTANSSVVNDGNAAQNVVEATLQGSTGSNLLLKNDGTLQIAEYISAALTILMQINPGAATAVLLGAAGRLVEIKGNFQVDGNDTVQGNETITGTFSSNNGVTFTDAGGTLTVPKVKFLSAAAGNTIIPGITVDASGDILFNIPSTANVSRISTAGFIHSSGRFGQSSDGDTIDANGVDFYAKGGANGAFRYQAPNGTTQWTRQAESHGLVSGLAPNGTSTVTHNLKVNGVSVQPDLVLVTPNVGSSSTATWSTLNVGTTTFQIYNSNSGVTQNFYWMCFKY